LVAAKANPPFATQARQRAAIICGIGMLAVGGWSVLIIAMGNAVWGTWLFTLVFGLGGLYGTLVGLVPVSVVADATGIEWRQFLYRKKVGWSEMSGIGIGMGRYVLPTPLGLRESVGIDLRKNDGAAGAYRRGFSGYDLNIRGDFKPRRQALAEELQRRLELARSCES
jgi:hypothetical protein